MALLAFHAYCRLCLDDMAGERARDLAAFVTSFTTDTNRSVA
jgi:hypothetical protein